MELILYNISKNLIPISICLALVLFLGVVIYIFTKKFDIHKKTIHYFGLLTGLNNRQIIVLSSIIIRTFMLIYTVCIYKSSILDYMVMILLIDIVYMILVPRKIIFETINITAQLILVYFINMLKTYRIEVSNEMYVEQIIILLSSFIIFYSVYFLLKNFEELITEKRRRKNG